MEMEVAQKIKEMKEQIAALEASAAKSGPVQEKEKKPDNVFFIGSKTYAKAVRDRAIAALNNGFSEVFLKAKGRAVSSAVNAEQALHNSYEGKLLSEFKVSTEKLPSKRDPSVMVSVSVMEIRVAKA